MTESLYTCQWQSPSNIALIKYWGKKKEVKQQAINASISMTLSECTTTTKIEVYPTPKQEISFEYYFHGERMPSFESKVYKLLTEMESHCNWLSSGYHLKIYSSNSFPHSAGIASSASSMSALSICILDIHHFMTNSGELDNDIISNYARLGSGSACRSIFPNYALWGKHPSYSNSSDLYAIPIDQKDIHPTFLSLQDSVLIVSSKEKAISSTQGHQSMDRHPYKNDRIIQAQQHMNDLLECMKSGDFSTFARICEDEALGLHALMLSASPGFNLLTDATHQIIQKIRKYREQKGIELCFTLDAGPNVHLLYSRKDKDKVNQFINDELIAHCENNQVIHDHIGEGPLKQII